MARGVKQTYATPLAKNVHMKKDIQPVEPLTQQEEVLPLLMQFRQLFIVCKLVGLYPQDLKAFREQQLLKASNVGALGVLMALIIASVLFILPVSVFNDADNSLKETRSTLSMVISVFLVYISLGMMATDQINAIRNQRRLNTVYVRLRAADAALFRENIRFDNTCVARRIRLLLLVAVLSELSILVSGRIFIPEPSLLGMSLLRIFACLPTFYNSLDKIWFAVTLWVLKLRFAAINQSIDDIVEAHERQKALHGAAFENENVELNNVSSNDDIKLEYLRKELSLQRVFQRNRIAPSKN